MLGGASSGSAAAVRSARTFRAAESLKLSGILQEHLSDPGPARLASSLGAAVKCLAHGGIRDPYRSA